MRDPDHSRSVRIAWTHSAKGAGVMVDWLIGAEEGLWRPRSR